MEKGVIERKRIRRANEGKEKKKIVSKGIKIANLRRFVSATLKLTMLMFPQVYRGRELPGHRGVGQPRGGRQRRHDHQGHRHIQVNCEASWIRVFASS